ncbi:MAG: hypothetical protein IKE57_03910 [Oscillospiraceae bacterium]|nr:hypothetical protein [Oscillospiraceae bacterium]
MTDAIYAAAEWLGREYGCEIPVGFYGKIREWQQWWEGYVPDFHRYSQCTADGRRLERRLYSLHMAKRVCEDWAGILLNDSTTVRVGDERSGLYLQGEDGTGGVFGRNRFWRMGNELVERAFALGTGAFVLRAQGVAAGPDGLIARGPGQVGVAYLAADQIIPLSEENGRITEAAFVSSRTLRGRQSVYVETHTLDDDGCYLIRNRFFDLEEGALRERELPPDVAAGLRTGSDRPWFAVVRPNIVANVPGSRGMGVSVFANAVDILKGVDLAYNNTNRDIYLGGRKVFYNRAMLQRTPDGAVISPDDVIQQLFTQVGDDMSFDARTMVQEYSPSLRAAENRDSVQAQLDYLAFQCGLGTHRYQFNAAQNVVRTATEYVGNRQELVQTAARHYILIEEAVKTLCAGILTMGREFFGADVDPDAEIAVRFENSYVIDKDKERAQDMRDVAAGLMGREEYRVKWYGETRREAEAWTAAHPLAERE